MPLFDRENRISITIASGLLAVTLLTGAGLASSKVSAEEESVTSNVSVTVTTSCTFKGTETVAHTANIENGTKQSEIGTTTLKAFCNDSGGFSIHAIGFTDTEYGKNVLSSQAIGDSADIATGTNISGNSSWAMKLDNSQSTAYPITLDNGYGSYSVVPTTYTKVAHRDSGTDVGTSATGATLTTTYQVYISSEQPADNYLGKVKYTMVHPSSEVPLQPVVTAANKISYNPNASGLVDTMDDQSITSSATSATLWASNFQRPGYGFAGWNDKFDMTGNNYGPNEDITFTAGQYSEENGGLSLYANWIKSQGTMQDWAGCNSMSQGQVTALTDSRDGNTYAVAKLADDKCWMIENLRLENTNSDNSTGALAQGYNSSFAGLADPETANFSNSTTANSLYSTDGSTEKTISGSYQGYRFPRYRNDNTSSSVSKMTTPTDANVYSYSNYYTWAAAIADTTHYSTNNKSVTDTSICPSGWRLPSGGQTTVNTTADFYTLGKAIMNNTEPDSNASGGYGYYSNSVTNDSGDTATKAFRKFPNNFLYSGNAYGSSVDYRGSSGNYWSSTANNSHYSYYLALDSSFVDPGTRYYYKYGGFSVRCVAGS